MTRPAPDRDVEARYECTACGRRVTDADSQHLTCEKCDGPLRNIGVSRDV